MRRAMLLAVGVGAGGMVLLALCIRVAASVFPERKTVQSGTPVAVQGTCLEAITPACYEGLFWEDGSDRPVTDIAALVVKNTGGCYIAQGAVVMDWGEDRYIFEISWLPPGEKALLLEKDAKTFLPHEDARFYGWTSTCLPERTGMVAVCTEEPDGVSLHNKTNTTLPSVTLYYKHYDWESRMYIGGVTYTYSVSQLPPGQSQPLQLPSFAAGYSRVVCVLDSVETE